MVTVTEGLQNLHRILVEIEDIQSELDRGPKRIAAAARKIGENEVKIDEQKALITDMRKAADGKSLQLKTNEARIVDLKVKLNEAKSNREYQIITGQMEADSMANSVLEDEILEALEKVDVADGVLTELKQGLTAAQERLKDVEKKVAAGIPGLEADMKAALEGRAEAEKIVPAKHRDQYQRMLATHGAATLAPVDEGCCSNCYGTLSAQEKVLLNTHQLIFCQACGRILFNQESAE